MRRLNLVDRLCAAMDQGLRTLLVPARPQRPSPASGAGTADLALTDEKHAAALMRVNHVGEICAQALYSAQALTTRSDQLRRQLAVAAQEEEDHLAWTAERVAALNGRLSLLNPVWWAGSFGIGCLAGLAGDAWSLGFVVETERQVEAHLASHLDRLPADDVDSRAVVSQMKLDEAAHADWAEQAGARPLPEAVKLAMRLAAKAMTTTAYRL